MSHTTYTLFPYTTLFRSLLPQPRSRAADPPPQARLRQRHAIGERRGGVRPAAPALPHRRVALRARCRAHPRAVSFLGERAAGRARDAAHRAGGAPAPDAHRDSARSVGGAAALEESARATLSAAHHGDRRGDRAP